MKLAGAKTLLCSRFFPKYFGFKKDFKFVCLIGVGGNIGNVSKRFDRFLFSLRQRADFNVVESSVLLLNTAFGFTQQDDFLNGVICVQTSLSANRVLKIMQHFEARFGRVRSFKNAPRTLDLDILYFSGNFKSSKRLTLPHHGVNKRQSVIVPLGLMKG